LEKRAREDGEVTSSAAAKAVAEEISALARWTAWHVRLGKLGAAHRSEIRRGGTMNKQRREVQERRKAKAMRGNG
jgi:hypothetical protein